MTVVNLKPCPSCESANVEYVIDRGGFTECLGCGVSGPHNDPTGEKWNALPRRGGVLDQQAAIDELLRERGRLLADNDRAWAQVEGARAAVTGSASPDEAMLMQAAAQYTAGLIAAEHRRMLTSDDVVSYRVRGLRMADATLDVIRARKRGE